ncbi:putative capsid protein [Fly associated circular virus 6]|uniref:Putative capsid protein n=1 Tax=Fly associated circular virus 6 TaxID=2293286 RepID=A0A346BPC5_9VIRU|nr:putative capsid protein [Fly associated circular virus 6]AXL65922.1 putative capsid protein [Fly associated circular virus 6]
MAWSRRRTRFQRQRPRRLRRARRLTRTRFRRYRPRGGGTRSATVKLTAETTYAPWQGPLTNVQAGWKPVAFTPQNLQGFNDYQSVYSQFRVKKCVVKINRGPDTNLVYLVVPSRAFAQTAAPSSSIANSWLAYVPPQTEQALRQTRWQKELMPSTTAGKVRFGFHPYTMITAMGPIAQGQSINFTRVWNLNKWTPMSWALAQYPMYMYGPYLCLNNALTNADPDLTTSVSCIIECYFQFKGQK